MRCDRRKWFRGRVQVCFWFFSIYLLFFFDILFLRFIIVCDCSFPVPVLLAPIVMCEQSVSLIIDAKVIIINAFLHIAAQPKS